ncbi:hypothetical protein ACERII_17385 [Evansella sp. AB-rgal1]|uniref:hypothetical protein n=1 Tax=Evansella sp. AB-rgal1 TaxID=3242696 RepID=UPI00359DE25E
MLFIGYGRLAQAITDILPKDTTIQIYSRTKKDLSQPHVSWLEPSKFHLEKQVWLFLPADVIPDFLKKHVNYFHRETTFFYCATKGRALEVKDLVIPTQTVIPIKFITQADQLRKDKMGMAALPRLFEKTKPAIEKLFGESLQIVIAEEEDVHHLNKQATQKAIDIIVELEKEMNDRGISKELVEHAAKQIIPGVITAYYQGTLGAFAKQEIVKRRENREG